MTSQEFLIYIVVPMLSVFMAFLGSLFIYYIRGIKLSFENMKKPMIEMEKSMHKLNTQIEVVITNRQNDREEIERIRQDLKDHINKV